VIYRIKFNENKLLIQIHILPMTQNQKRVTSESRYLVIQVLPYIIPYIPVFI